jgi:hypothetical protein
MKTKLLVGVALACSGAVLAGCAGLGGGNSDLLRQLDGNFAGCERHITFQAGLGVVAPGAQVSGSVDCKGVSASGSTPVAPAAAG